MTEFLLMLMLAAALSLLSGCAGPRSPVVPATVVVPIECREEVPERPVMPTEGLAEASGVDAYVQAAKAEIDFREGYETKLVTALRACVAPVERGGP